MKTGIVAIAEDRICAITEGADRMSRPKLLSLKNTVDNYHVIADEIFESYRYAKGEASLAETKLEKKILLAEAKILGEALAKLRELGLHSD